MKKSLYNIFVEQGKVTVCYNSYTDSYLIINTGVYREFITQPLTNFALVHENTYNSLVENGFIIPDERDEIELIRMEHKQAISEERYLQLMVYPTQDCNLKCWYCYENHVTGSRMSQEVQANIIKFVNRQIQTHKLENLNLTFFGGEPLLSFDKIAYPLSCAVKSLCENNGINFTTFFVTNASLINENMIDKFQEINSYFQITLDGCREKHNQVRIGKSRSFLTYDRIIQALDLLSNKLKPTFEEYSKVLTLRINYDNDTLRNIESILGDIRSFNKDAIFIHLERVWQTRGQVDEEQIKLLINAVRMFTKEGFKVGLGVFGNKRLACPAERLNYAIINYNGLVYKCNGRNLTEETREGVLNEEGEIEWDRNRIAKRLGKTTFENPMCLNCKMLPRCMGPCSQKNMENNWENLEKVCSLLSIDMSLEQYILLHCETEWMNKKIHS